MTGRRDLILRAAAAIWGFAIAISPAGLARSAGAGQLPGYATSMGFDARARRSGSCSA
jgi:hypothetical protein